MKPVEPTHSSTRHAQTASNTNSTSSTEPSVNQTGSRRKRTAGAATSSSSATAQATQPKRAHRTSTAVGHEGPEESSSSTAPIRGIPKGLLDPLADVRRRLSDAHEQQEQGDLGAAQSSSNQSLEVARAARPKRLTRAQLAKQLSDLKDSERSSATGDSNNNVTSSSTATASSNNPASKKAGSTSKRSAAALPPTLETQVTVVLSELDTQQPQSANTGICQSANSSGASGVPASASTGVPASASVRVLPLPTPTSNQNPTDMSNSSRTSGAAAASHFLGSLVPRVQQMLAGASHHHNAKMSTLLEALRSGEEPRQQDAALELAELLLLGNEDSLSALPIRDVVNSLCACLQQNEHNLELSLTITRCITNLLEALPRALPLLIDAVPLLLKKLTHIECIDVAEQALAALELMSRRHGKHIMQHGGIAATISHLDFFNVASQRVALTIAANCAQFVSVNDFALHVQPCLEELTNRFVLEDKRALECVCLLFGRLVDNMSKSPDRLNELASAPLLTNVQSLLLTQPPAVGPSTFQNVVRMLRVLCTKCPHIAVQLLQMGLVGTLRALLTGCESDADTTDIELLNRPPQQLQEIVLLIGELLPKLPGTGVFEIDTALGGVAAQTAGAQHRVQQVDPSTAWQYQDENSQWHHFQWYEARLLELAYLSGERAVALQSVAGVPQTTATVVDMQRMVYVNETHGTNPLPVQRKTQAPGNRKGAAAKEEDAREQLMEKEPELASKLVRALFPVLIEIDASSAGPTIRFETMRTMLRMVQPSTANLLGETLANMQFACHIAAALSSQRTKDLPTVASAIQLVSLLSDKMPDIYVSAFRREGVVHQLQKLSELTIEDTPHNSPQPRHRLPDCLLPRQAYSATELSDSMMLLNHGNVAAAAAAASTAGSSMATGSTATTGSGSSRAHGKESRKKAFLNSLRLPQFGRNQSTTQQQSGSGSSSKVHLQSARSTGALPAAVDGANTSRADTSMDTSHSGPGTRRGKRRHMMGSTTSTASNSNAGTAATATSTAAATSMAMAQSLTTAHSPHWTHTPSPTVGTRHRIAVPPPSMTQEQQTASSTATTASALPMMPPPTPYAFATDTASAHLEAMRTIRNQQRRDLEQLEEADRQRLRATTTTTIQVSSASGSTAAPTLHSMEAPATAPAQLGAGSLQLHMLSSAYQQQQVGLSQALASYVPMSMTAAPAATTGAGNNGVITSAQAAALGGAGLAQSQVAAGSVPNLHGMNAQVTAQQTAHYNFLTSMSAQAHAAALANAASSGSNTLSTTSSGGSVPSSAVPSSMSAMYQHAISSHANKRRLRVWIKDTARKLLDGPFAVVSDEDECDTVDRMAALSKRLVDPTSDHGSALLTQLSDELLKADLSAFELSHSGLITALIKYLTDESGDLLPSRNTRLRRFLDVFMGIQLRGQSVTVHVDGAQALSQLVTRLLSVLSQCEQFPVRTNDIVASQQHGAGPLRGASALRFFQTHQLKCVLRRHPSAMSELREWRHGHGSIRVDPLTPVSAIERYLLERGVLRRGQSGDEDDLDNASGEDRDTSDDELEQAARYQASRNSGEQLQILLNDHVLPSNLPILQAIRQYGVSGSATSSDMDSVALAAGLWMNTHCLWYRTLQVPTNQPGTSGAAGSSAAADGSAAGTSSAKAEEVGLGKSKKRRSPGRSPRNQENKLWTEGLIPVRTCALAAYLVDKLPRDMDDPSAECMLLLRVLFGINTHWCAVFKDQKWSWPSSVQPIVPQSVFVSSKLAAKATRQLNDVLSVATQYLPPWLTDVAVCCAFLLPFSVRRQLLYASAFGRERAIVHVAAAESHPNDNEHNRLTPRLERKKIVVKREEVLRHGEDALHKMGNSRPVAVLEVSFEGEAGTGYGPTLEFYSNVSKELQRHNLKLFHGEKVRLPAEHMGGAMSDYISNSYGLYPMPNAHAGGGKQRDQRIKHFEFLGRLMAQALIDARMLDISLNPLVYRWLLADENGLCLADLEVLDANLWRALRQTMSMSQKELDDMCMSFTLPGYDTDMIKAGKDLAVNKHNAQHYVELVAHWRLVAGVQKEMDALLRGMRSVVDTNHLKCFYAHELDELFCGSSSSAHWEAAALRATIKPDHGFTHDSQQITWLVQMMSTFDAEKQRKFLQFVTGSPKLPVGGFRGLNPPLTAVRKTVPFPDADLPSAMTCYNYLKIPQYSSYEVLHAKFEIAMQHVYAFFLT